MVYKNRRATKDLWQEWKGWVSECDSSSVDAISFHIIKASRGGNRREELLRVPLNIHEFPPGWRALVVLLWNSGGGVAWRWWCVIIQLNQWPDLYRLIWEITFTLQRFKDSSWLLFNRPIRGFNRKVSQDNGIIFHFHLRWLSTDGILTNRYESIYSIIQLRIDECNKGTLKFNVM